MLRISALAGHQFLVIHFEIPAFGSLKVKVAT